jgi:Purple acid Phosphatase, N-terminal domain
MKKLLPKLLLAFTAGVLLYPTPMANQVSPSAQKASLVRIKQGPELEMTKDDMAIITWTSNNPGGSPEHYGVVHYGTDPKKLSETATSHIRLNPGHSYTVFRVYMDGLKSRSTYYYSVDSTGPDGASDGVKSPIRKFTTR